MSLRPARRRPLRALVAALALAATAAAAAPATAPAQDAPPEDDRYALANGCHALRSLANGRFVTQQGDAYRATAGGAGQAEPFFMEPVTLGRYLFFGKGEDLLSRASGAGVTAADRPRPEGDWVVDVVDGAFRITAAEGGRVLAAAGERVITAAPGTTGPATRFGFAPASGCDPFPEAELNVTGAPSRGRTPFGEVRGLLDAHTHLMAFEFLGGRARCARPWHPYGITFAMVDCPDHGPNGTSAVLENVVSSGPPRPHDTVGWPTFRDWPSYRSLTHEQVYWRWLERAYRGGLRIFVNLLVDNEALCEVYPFKAPRENVCDEMATVRLEHRRTMEFQDYVDAQSGGPGRGWFRVVTSPSQARRVINQGKLAVVLGIETSKLFGCGLRNDTPTCTREDVDRQLAEVHRMGVRDLELINKFDNAFGGVAGDAGDTGVITNTGNFQQTGQFWRIKTCDNEAGVSDRPQYAIPGQGRDQLLGNGLQAFLPQGATPIYPAEPHCNQRGLSPLGEHLVRRMMDLGMIIDPDHLSVAARDHLLNVVEAERYSGIISSHSWSTQDAFPRIYRLGGIVTPYAGGSEGFVEQWRETRPMRDDDFYFGFGYGADMNGFGSQGPPRGEDVQNPVRYPFRSFDGRQTIDRQRSGERVFDLNRDGVAHYGLYPDWIEDLRQIAGPRIVEDMARGAEAYLQMWERAEGVPHGCRAARGRFSARGLAQVRLGLPVDAFLRRAGQPETRAGRVWTWCVENIRERRIRARVTAVLTRGGRSSFVGSTAISHTARGVGARTRASRLRGVARPFGRGLLVADAGRRARYVWRIRGGRVRWTAVVSRSASRTPAALRRTARLGGFR